MNIKSVRVFRGFLLMAAAVFALQVRGDTSRYAGPNWGFVDSKKALEAAGEITPAKYPDCDEATVEKRMVRVYRPDGTGECQDETFVKVLTEKGKRDNRTLSFSFMLPYSTVEVVEAEVLRPGGQAVPVDVGANSKETIDDSQMAMNIYDPNMRVLRLSIPKLEIGDLLHSIVRQTIQRPIIPGEFAEESVFEGRGCIRHLSYEAHTPAERPLQRVVLRDEVPGTVHYSEQPGEDQTLIRRWEVRNVPRMFDEPSMPPYEMVLQRLLVSTTPDWARVSKWYWELSKPHLEATTPEMKQTVESLIAGSKTGLEKVKAVFYHVSKKVRYMGLTPEKDRPGFEPHDVHITFDKKYGVCRDKAALLVSMLRTAGLEAYPVLINVGLKKDAEVPDADFNHAIVGVELQKGQYVLMDPTDENTRELLPSGDRNQSYLVCRPEGETIRLSPIQPPEDHILGIKTTGVLSAAGALEAKSELTFQGVNDDAYRNMFAHMKPDDRRRFFERNLKQAMPGARLKSLQLMPEDMLDVSQEVRAVLEFSVDGLAADGANVSVVNLPWIGKGLGVVNFILGGAGLDKRKYPMQTWVTCGLKEDLSLKLGRGFGQALSLPSCSPVEDDCVSCRESFGARDGSLICSRELKLKVVEFSPEQYLKLKQTLKGLEYDARKAPVMALSPDAALQPADTAQNSPDSPVESNARLLSSHKELEVTDAHTALYRARYSKRILTYAGKIREAEVKIEYNPACQEARLVRAVVISKSGQRQEIAKDEIHIMDAGWNASAKRYSGGKILVANLPGVDLGSTIEVEFEIASKDRAFVAGFEPFQLPDELEHKSFRLTAPADLQITKMISGAPGLLDEQSRTDNGKQVFQWTAQNVKALPAENQLPPEWVFVAGVAYFAGDPGAYVKELDETMVGRSHQRAKAEELARQLTHETKTRLEAVKAVRDYVAKSIRLAGPAFAQLPLKELSAADTTLADGYGHLADRAILLHAMLEAAGFEPQFVLASTLPPIAGITNVALSFPLPDSFQTPLVRVSVQGQTFYLNDTDQYATLGSTAHDGRLGFRLSDHQWETIEAASNCRDRTETVYSLRLDDTGKTRLGVDRHYFGGSYNAKNRFFSELPPEERKRYYQEIVSSVAQGARPLGDLVTQFEAYPGVEQFAVEIDNYGVVDGKYLYFDLPFTPSLFPAGADHRALPLFIPWQRQESVRTEIELPPGFPHLVMAPKSDSIAAPDGGGYARISAKDTPGKCVMAHEFETSPAIVPPRDYSAMLKVESALGRKSSRVFLLEKGD
jgi:transglutaminase-like putative cysteine protease